MRVLTVGDVVAESGLKLLERSLRAFRETERADFVIVNGENIQGKGILPGDCDRLYRAGADVITLGNHAFARREIRPHIEEDRYLLRPANFSVRAPGRGWGVYDAGRGLEIAVVCLEVRAFMHEQLESPFFLADRLLGEIRADVIMVEAHGEATAEKGALGHYLDGRVAAVYGTHTHIPTADECILPGGTGFITDIGMTGPIQSVLGMDIQRSIDRFLGVPCTYYKSAAGPCRMSGALFDIDERTGRCVGVERVSFE